jgi:predicted nucleotidyltransferase
MAGDRTSFSKRVFEKLPNIQEARRYSDEKLALMRGAIVDSSELKDVLVGTFGSYARREASKESDLDFFAICKSEDQIDSARAALEKISPRLIQLAGRPPAKAGAFGDVDDLPTMLTNIGGNDDHNAKITRRVLLLLEGEWLNNEDMFKQCRRSLLDRYIRDTITSHQLALFLLNDIIRYYRTICVDFEFKTVETENPKPWGTRNIKLVFSRKLLYFSVLAVAEAMQRSYEEKLRIVTELIDLPVIERVLKVCGDQAVNALQLYDAFLGEFAKEEIRSKLDETKESERTKEPFRRLKDEGHHFSWRLMSLFRQTYDISHPIHRLIFL